ncbi:MAG TPA: aminotransferase class I/II-fold pyridoxal phosphate-dependent enzyme, partial [Pirellulales bacterium]|nr:aminotransferase class I/II-fold pyridoxal phosphate-dependent enzyme [Pirellulales bacterium]
PLYIGQMLKPPHAIARLAYALAMFLNPNNHAADGGRASSIMEQEVVAELAALVGWRQHLGHLTSGGTMANFEALWIARQLRPGAAIAASTQAHYTHSRLAAVLNIPFCAVPVDASGRMNVAALTELAAASQIGTIVASLGTTAAGAVDPLPEILRVAAAHGLRVHVDAAYGGYFKLAGNLDPPAVAAFDSMHRADSLVVDPHKHGLQPYGCGCVLFQDPSVARFYQHDSPYTYFAAPATATLSPSPLMGEGLGVRDRAPSARHLGEISLECSRSGASAVALWATLELLPLEPGGEFARGLEAGRDAALTLHAHLANHARFAPLLRPELDIVTWAIRAPSASESSLAARRLFEAAARRQLHLALATFPRAMLEPAQPVQHWDTDEITCLRACVMKPEHRDWLPRIITILDAAASEIFSSLS